MKKIIFFDSECGMCDKFIVYLNKIDKKDELIFCSLKSDFASNFFKEKHNKLSFESIIFFQNGIFYYKSSAIKKIFQVLCGNSHWVPLVISISPQFLSNYFYDIFAKLKHNYFESFLFWIYPHHSFSSLVKTKKIIDSNILKNTDCYSVKLLFGCIGSKFNNQNLITYSDEYFINMK